MNQRIDELSDFLAQLGSKDWSVPDKVRFRELFQRAVVEAVGQASKVGVELILEDEEVRKR